MKRETNSHPLCILPWFVKLDRLLSSSVFFTLARIEIVASLFEFGNSRLAFRERTVFSSSRINGWEAAVRASRVKFLDKISIDGDLVIRKFWTRETIKRAWNDHDDLQASSFSSCSNISIKSGNKHSEILRDEVWKKDRRRNIFFPRVYTRKYRGKFRGTITFNFRDTIADTFDAIQKLTVAIPPGG